MAYKRHHGDWFAFTAIVLIGVAVGIAVPLIAGERAEGWILAFVFGCPISALVAAFIYTTKRDRQRESEIGERLAARGFTTLFVPDAHHKREFFLGMAYLEHWVPLVTGDQGLVWYASRQDVNDYEAVFHHRYFTGMGKHRRVHDHTVWATCRVHQDGSRVPGDVRLQAFKLRGLDKRAVRHQKGEPISTGDEDFDRVWLVYSDREPSSAFLNSSVRAALVDSPAGESWHVGDGWVACAVSGTLDAENTEIFLDRAQQVLHCSR